MSQYYSDTTSERVFIDSLIDSYPIVLPKVVPLPSTAGTYDPILDDPEGSMENNLNSVFFKYVLPVAAIPGSVKFTFTRTSGQADGYSPHVSTLPTSFESAGEHSDSYPNARTNLTDLKNAGAGKAKVSTSFARLIPGAVYRITFSYVDVYVGIPRSVSVDEFLYDPDNKFDLSGSRSALQWKGLSASELFGDTIPALTTKLKTILEPVKVFLEIFKVILKILKVFLLTFNSAAAIIEAIVTQIESTIKELLEQLGATGIYGLVVIPPIPTDKEAFSNTFITSGADGGFDGFMKMVRAASANTLDPNRPKFNDSAIVGGCVVMIDTDTLADLYIAWNMLQELLFPALPRFQYPAPTNVVAYPGYFLTEDGTPITSFDAKGVPLIINSSGKAVEAPLLSYSKGIKIEWDCPPGFTVPPFLDGGFRVFRSSGQPEASVTEHIQVGSVDPKETTVIKGKAFTDWGTDGREATYLVSQKKGFYIDIEPALMGKTPGTTYFYTVRVQMGKASNGALALGAPSYEVSSSYVSCVNPDSALVIYHAEGDAQYVSPGYKDIPRWYSYTVGDIPGFKDVVDLLMKYLSILKGWVKTSSGAVGDYIDGLIKKVDSLIKIVDQIIKILDIIENLTSLPSMNFLHVPAQMGGLPNFVGRIASAKHPQEDEWDPSSGIPKPSFSGSNGFTAGIVLLYGLPGADQANSAVDGLRAQQDALRKELEELQSGATTKPIEDRIKQVDKRISEINALLSPSYVVPSEIIPSSVTTLTPAAISSINSSIEKRRLNKERNKLKIEKSKLQRILVRTYGEMAKRIITIEIKIKFLDIEIKKAQAEAAFRQLSFATAQKVVAFLNSILGGG